MYGVWLNLFHPRGRVLRLSNESHLLDAAHFYGVGHLVTPTFVQAHSFGPTSYISSENTPCKDRIISSRGNFYISKSEPAIYFGDTRLARLCHTHQIQLVKSEAISIHSA
jgi:hypothetical protein